MREITSKPLDQYTKRTGVLTLCPRSIYSDLIAACPAKKAGKPCTYCFNEILEKKYDFRRSFKRGFRLKELKNWLTRKPGRLATALKDTGVVRINANTDFYPELDETNADHVDIFTRSKIKVIAITKQDLRKLPLTMKAIKENGGVVQPTFNFLDPQKAKEFEPYWTNITERKAAIEHYVKKMPKNVVLRISPIIIGVNDGEVEEIMKWFGSIGGKRVIIHFLRKSTPEMIRLINKYGGKVPTKADEFYYDREMLPVIKRLKNIDVKMNICSEFELNKKYGHSGKCCFV
jgi:DNA repair photolyase